MSSVLEPVVPADAVDADWLTGILTRAGVLTSGRVVGVRREPCGTGQLADSYRFTLRYDPPNAGPATIVGKFAPQDATSREVGHSTGYYLSEIRFYTDLAPGLGLEIPVPIHAALAPNKTDFVLLMEDLSPARSVDQLLGCTADEAALVVERAATLHARSWRNQELARVDWLQSTSTVLTDVTDHFAHTVESFPHLYGDLVAAPDLAEAASLIEHTQAWKRVFSDRQCLWHSDLRVDNVLFDARGGARPAVLLDWQGVGFGRGTIDLAYFLATSLTTPDRRAHEQELVKHYHRALVGTA